MSFINILSLLFLIFTFYLLVKKRTYGKSFLYFGGLTYLFVMIYTLLPNISIGYKSIALFICFSLLLIIFGLMCGSITFLIKKEDKVSQIVSIISSSLLMFSLFNKQGLISYKFLNILIYIFSMMFYYIFYFFKNFFIIFKITKHI